MRKSEHDGGESQGVGPRSDSALRYAVRAAGVRREIARLMGGRGLGSYSTKVPQQAWTQADLGALSGTVACGYALWWTGCHWMACKRSGVRIPIAPPQVRGIIRNLEPQSSGAWYSSKVPQRQRREVPYSHSDKAPPSVRPAGMALPRLGAEAA